jgi:hypothetical protein
MYIPAGIREITGLSLADSGTDVRVDPRHPSLRVSSHFLVGPQCAIRYIGNDAVMTIGNDIVSISIQRISHSCFRQCSKLSQLTFEDGCSLSSLGESAFEGCSVLLSIRIPSSITTISARCFMNCSGLSTLEFEPDARIAVIDELAFGYCHSLQSVVIPPSIETIAKDCFYGCHKLSALTFAPGCRKTVLVDFALPHLTVR